MEPGCCCDVMSMLTNNLRLLHHQLRLRTGITVEPRMDPWPSTAKLVLKISENEAVFSTSKFAFMHVCGHLRKCGNTTHLSIRIFGDFYVYNLTLCIYDVNNLGTNTNENIDFRKQISIKYAVPFTQGGIVPFMKKGTVLATPTRIMPL